MPNCCAIVGCFNNSDTYITRTRNCHLKFHRLPLSNSQLTKVWLSKCKQNDNIKITSLVVCEEHFTKDDYIPSKKGLLARRFLKPLVVPTVFSEQSRSQMVAIAAKNLQTRISSQNVTIDDEISPQLDVLKTKRQSLSQEKKRFRDVSVQTEEDRRVKDKSVETFCAMYEIIEQQQKEVLRLCDRLGTFVAQNTWLRKRINREEE